MVQHNFYFFHDQNICSYANFWKIRKRKSLQNRRTTKKKKKRKSVTHIQIVIVHFIPDSTISTKYFIAQPENFTVRKLKTLSYKIYTENVVNPFNLHTIAIFTRIKFFTTQLQLLHGKIATPLVTNNYPSLWYT